VDVVDVEGDEPLGVVVEVDVVEVVEVDDVERDVVVVVSSGGTISCTAHPASMTACPSGQFKPG